jgi:hypothetical protein
MTSPPGRTILLSSSTSDTKRKGEGWQH